MYAPQIISCICRLIKLSLVSTAEFLATHGSSPLTKVSGFTPWRRWLLQIRRIFSEGFPRMLLGYTLCKRPSKIMSHPPALSSQPTLRNTARPDAYLPFGNHTGPCGFSVVVPYRPLMFGWRLAVRSGYPWRSCPTGIGVNEQDPRIVLVVCSRVCFTFPNPLYTYRYAYIYIYVHIPSNFISMTFEASRTGVLVACFHRRPFELESMLISVKR